MSTIEYLRNGDISFLERDLPIGDLKITAELISESKYKDEILEKILPKYHDENIGYFAKYLFNIIYLDRKYLNYTYHFIKKQYVTIEQLDENTISNILEKTTWGFDFIYDNLDSLSTAKYGVLEVIINYLRNNLDKYKKVLNKILQSHDQKAKDNFIINLLSKKLITEEEVIMALYQDKDEYQYEQLSFIEDKEEKRIVLSDVPKYLNAYKTIRKDFSKLILNNPKVIIASSKSNKMELMKYIMDNGKINYKELLKYRNLLKLYDIYSDTALDNILSKLIIDDKLEELNKKLDNLDSKDISFLGKGSTTVAFKINDKVLKFTAAKHSYMDIPEIFLLAPTETTIIYKNSSEKVGTIEYQDYLSKSYNNKEMTESDIDTWLKELTKQGYIIADPHCQNKSTDNFGFLKDYHDANLGNYKNHEQLPEWFKKRPIVLYDIDLIYDKEKGREKILKLF